MWEHLGTTFVSPEGVLGTLRGAVSGLGQPSKSEWLPDLQSWALSTSLGWMGRCRGWGDTRG